MSIFYAMHLDDRVRLYKKSIQEDKSNSAVSIGLSVYIDPGSPSVVVIEVSPEVPSSAFEVSAGPVPKAPCLDGSLIHVWQVEAVVEFGPSCLVAKVSFADIVASVIINEVVSPNWNCYLDYSSSPSVVEAAVDHCEGSVFDCHSVEGSLECFVGGDADEGQVFIAGLVSFEGVAVVAREPACPVTVVVWPYGRLVSESLLDGLETELVHV